MRRALLLAFLFVPAAASSGPVAVPAVEECAPPCGWINPLIKLEFPDKPDCSSGLVLGPKADADLCIPLPAVGETLTYHGTAIVEWWVCDEGTYPADPQQDIVLDFRPTRTHPDWMDMTIEPASHAITFTDVLDPQNFYVEETANGAEIWFRMEFPMSVSFTRTGSPTDEFELQVIDDRGGVKDILLQAVTSESGGYYRPGYGLETFRFDMDETVDMDAAQEAPAGFGLLGILAALGLRRR